MLFDQTAARDNIRNRDGKRVFYLRKGDQLTSAARDFLNRERIEILPASQAAPQRYRLLEGGYLEEKPEDMTHLYGDVLVRKDHPRIRFRGKLDSLQAELILCQLADQALEAPVGEVLALARQILRCEVLDQPLAWNTLCGLDREQLRRHSQFPQDYYGQPHFMPGAADGPVLAQLNRARCAAREAELAAVEAFPRREGKPCRQDLMEALNRMSSMLYILMVQQKSGKLPQGGFPAEKG